MFLVNYFTIQKLIYFYQKYGIIAFTACVTTQYIQRKTKYLYKYIRGIIEAANYHANTDIGNGSITVLRGAVSLEPRRRQHVQVVAADGAAAAANAASSTSCGASWRSERLNQRQSHQGPSIVVCKDGNTLYYCTCDTRSVYIFGNIIDVINDLFLIMFT